MLVPPAQLSAEHAGLSALQHPTPSSQPAEATPGQLQLLLEFLCLHNVQLPKQCSADFSSMLVLPQRGEGTQTCRKEPLHHSGGQGNSRFCRGEGWGGLRKRGQVAGQHQG